MITENSNLYGLQTKLLGNLYLRAPEFTQYCSEEKAMEKLRHEACLMQANLINITSKAYDGNSFCYCYTADLFSVDLNNATIEILSKKQRTVLTYNNVKILKWDYFFILLPDSSSVPYDFVSNIEVEFDRSSITGIFNKYKAQGVFYCDVSKVKPSFITEKNLHHIEVLYELSQIYAKKAEKFLNTERPRYGKLTKVATFLERYLNDLLTEQKLYIKETEYGSNELMKMDG